MEYEKKYKEALEKAKSMIDNFRKGEATLAASELESLFPELKESEDERIRKAIIGYIDHDQHYGVSKKDMLAWLEKQGKKEEGYEWDAEKKELKTIEHNVQLTEFEDAIKDMMNDYRDAIGNNDATIEEIKKHAAYLLSLIHQKPAWSEEDERMRDRVKESLNCFIDCVEENTDLEDDTRLSLIGNVKNEIKWVESLRERTEKNKIKWQPNTEDNKPTVKHSVLMKTTHGIAEGEREGNDIWYQYRWRSRIKDSDVLAWMELSDLMKE